MKLVHLRAAVRFDSGWWRRFAELGCVYGPEWWKRCSPVKRLRRLGGLISLPRILARRDRKRPASST
jgi:hypothetical protein